MTDNEEKITSQLRERARDLIESGQMPSLERVLEVVVNVRKKYAPKIKAARQAALFEGDEL